MLNLLLRLVAALPLRAVHFIGGLLGRVVYWLSPAYRRRTNENLALAGYRDPALRREAVAGAGRQGLETPWIWRRPRADLAPLIEVADLNVVDDALGDGRPVMFLPPHLGCFEVTAQFYAAFRPEAKTRPMTVLYRIPHKSILRPLVESGRAADGLLLAPAEMRGVRMLMKALKERQVVGILPDQVPSRGEGVWAPFFGRWAYTMTLPARLARQFDAIVLFVYGERLPRGAGYRIHLRRLEEELTGDSAHDAGVMNRGLEALIRECPAQYLWGYNRYKVPAGAEPPPAGLLT
ncbi:MAG TPA: lysophospholipid acyltransferase family protein [Burkholderiaceae bacterium]|nr:lysophospholipid acyltransferase family protein [Burkholderiaceae bacterium]